jgi:predicted DNA-binding transcriptional regulator AlpA
MKAESLIDATRPETWPLIMTFAEVCQVLRISTRTAYTLRQQHRFPVPPITPRISGSAPKFYRDDVLQALKVRSGQTSLAERRKVLSRVG